MAGRGRPKNAVEENQEEKEQSIIRTETVGSKKRADEAWRLLDEQVEYKLEKYFKDDKEKAKIIKISKFYHVTNENHEPGKVITRIMGVYKKYKGQWTKIGGHLPVSMVTKATKLTL